MTKAFTPEFTDRAGAIRFVQTGRKGLTRPTKDAWNTHVELQPSTAVAGEYDALLVHNGDTILRYFIDRGSKREEIAVYASTSNFTMRKRINDYALTPRNLELLADLSIRGKVGEAVGIQGIVVPIHGRIGRIVGACFIEDDNNVRGLARLTMPRWPRDEVRTLAKEWAARVTQSLKEDVISEVLDAPLCINCSPTYGGQSVGRFTGDREHLFAHIFGQQITPLFLLKYLGIPGAMLNATSSSSGAVSIGRITESTAAYISRHLIALALATIE